MSLKSDFMEFAEGELKIPLVGIVAADDFSGADMERLSFVQKKFAEATPLSGGIDTVFQPKDLLPEAKSVVIVGAPGFLGRMQSFEECRKELLGCAEQSHVNVKYLQNNAERSSKLTDFFAGKGYQCFSMTGGSFPIKLMASKCGVGVYGKNAVILHPDYGSWITLGAFITDAEMEPDQPMNDVCGKCDLCMRACPTNALSVPYRCDMTKCIDFHLGHNKKNIPREIRAKCGNLLGEGCTVCRDACPKNRNLKKVEGYETPKELLYPSLFKIAEITDEEWDNGYAMTLMGFFLMDKKYLQRNAVLGLGNFRDERALSVLQGLLYNSDEELAGYAAWAAGMIGGGVARQMLNSALNRRTEDSIRSEIEFALSEAN